ncbi:hypothetical protein [Polymorphospora sp. NPDC050346]|uniref:hypothetical protein n=1 Tax=Polymorphospora sp. NPDC050346 TaxID=3155780 RepID=UPI0033EC16FB
MIVFISVGTVGALGTNLIVGAAPPERGGSAAALSSMGGELGVALGVAMLGSLGAAVYRESVDVPDGTPATAVGAAGGSMEGAVTAARDLPPDTAAELLSAAATAYTNGLNAIGLTCAVIAATTAIIALTTLRGNRGAVLPGEGSARAGEGARGERGSLSAS